MSLKDFKKVWGQGKSARAYCEGKDAESETSLQELKPSLPLLQVWPSQDSPRADVESQSFEYPTVEDPPSTSSAHHDSGIDSVQVSPCGGTSNGGGAYSGVTSPSSLLHPDHARYYRRPSSPEPSVEDSDHGASRASRSSSNASSLNSVSLSLVRECWERNRRRSSSVTLRDSWESNPRRSSTLTPRYSLLDALDLEYALLRAAARGSVGPYSFTGSIHKLTFTQSLAFPGLARGLAHRRRSPSRRSSGSPNPDDLTALAKVATAALLMIASLMVFGVVYKYVKTRGVLLPPKNGLDRKTLAGTTEIPVSPPNSAVHYAKRPGAAAMENPLFYFQFPTADPT